MSKPRSRIQKGRAEQRRVLEAFKKAFNLSDDDARTAIGAENGTDIKFNKITQQRIQLCIEVKNVRSINLFSAWAQAKANTTQGNHPALVIHQSVPGNKERLIVVPLEHYLELRRQLLGKTGTCSIRTVTSGNLRAERSPNAVNLPGLHTKLRPSQNSNIPRITGRISRPLSPGVCTRQSV